MEILTQRLDEIKRLFDAGCMAERGTETRERIIKAAVRQFADHGFAGASLREITRAARANIAAVNYHFGSKEGLYHAAVDRFFEQIRDERLGLLEKAEQRPAGDPALVDAILYAMIAPNLGLLRRRDGIHYLRLLLRFNTEPHDITLRVYRDEIAPVRLRFIRALRRAFPAIDEATLMRAFGFVANLMVSAPFDRGFEAMTGKPATEVGPAELTETVVAFAAAGLRQLAGQSVVSTVTD